VGAREGQDLCGVGGGCFGALGAGQMGRSKALCVIRKACVRDERKGGGGGEQTGWGHAMEGTQKKEPGVAVGSSLGRGGECGRP